MLYGDRQIPPTQYYIRELPLLEGERIEEQFVPDGGLVSGLTDRGELLVLTSLRIISFVHSEGRKETFMAPLEELKGVSVRANTRGFRDLFQGLILMLIGTLSYFIIGYVIEQVAVASALGAGIMFVGVLFIAKYLFWEEEGTVGFQAGSWELSFPYKNTRASGDVYKLVDRFFQLKLNGNTHHPRVDRLG